VQKQPGMGGKNSPVFILCPMISALERPSLKFPGKTYPDFSAAKLPRTPAVPVV